MLSGFVRKKKKEGILKTLNIESIQNAIGKPADADACKQSHEAGRKEADDVVNKEEKFLSPRKKQKTVAVAGQEKRLGGCLENYDIVSESSFVVDSKEVVQPECSTGCERVPSYPLDTPPYGNASDSIEARKLKVMNHATRNIEIKYSIVNAALYLPKSFKMISSLYKIISTIINFNKKRGLALIFVKYKESIERLFKHRVEMDMLEQLNFIADGNIRFIPVEVLEGGARVPTFKIDIVQSIDIDFALFNYLCEAYKAWLDRNCSVGLVGKIHPDFLEEVPSIPMKPFRPSLQVKSTDEPLIRKIAKEKTGSILDRIKERERLRREEFVREHAVDRDYEGRLASLFEIGNREALKMDDVLFKLGGFDCKAQVLKVLGDKYAVRRINGEEYIVKKQ